MNLAAKRMDDLENILTLPYKEALTKLSKLKTSMDKEIYFYNLGMLHYKNNEFSLAKLNFIQAKALGFEDRDSFILLKEVDRNLNVQNIENKKMIIEDHIFDLTYRLHPESFIYIGTLFVLISLACSFRKVSKLLILFFSFLGILIGGWGYFYKFNYDKVVLLKQKSLRQGPSKIFEPIFELPKGGHFIMNKTYENWGHIIYPSSYRGWIKTDKEEYYYYE
ncbi:MAG: hypothetical protein N4A33_08635 [Bacteriovoracaceae bacterium]|jgi:hypothetical protein|nr:hypothetical protein [Bacteriovoracaceae bacterium]